MANNNIDSNILDNIIVGRVEPRIYAFSTQTVPNYLKVGDTYRPLEVRLDEWRKKYPNLVKQFEYVAKVDQETYFRDYAVHHFLENDRSRGRLQRNTIPDLEHYSKEFFENATVEDIQDAIIDIREKYEINSPLYQLYKFADSPIPLTHTYERNCNYDPRPNQDATIRKFRQAYKSGRTNLLMYAVMRFGKSFTSLCCAVEMEAKLVVVVSAKADVREEWKKTTQSHIKFEGYEFIDSNDLLQSKTTISGRLQRSKLVIFLTLQDLQGHKIKSKHKELFSKDIDLLIVDETHFGARAEQFGVVLRDYDNAEYQAQQTELNISNKELSDFENQIKSFQSKVKLHLSGTPYRILMGSEFEPDDVIAFYQFTDIVKDQELWDATNFAADEPKEEWENPYYGFPQMVRFAFNPNKSSRKKIEALRSSGISSAFSALFKPKSINKDEQGLYKEFDNEQEVLELLEVIDGSKEDDDLLGFLDYDKIKDGKMCRHIVCVLPFRASCDAFEELINRNKDRFKHLSNYVIINIAGVESALTTEQVKAKITQLESEDKKSITLTVNKMLTGSTVEQWDTMLYLKDTSSPQEYDQAIFRLQNQYIRTYISEEGKAIKYNMKPQTLLVDFSPSRMFYMQEQKSQIYNANIEKSGNDKLIERISEELRISPIIVLNKSKISEITPTDILSIVAEYSRDKSVNDEARNIPIDQSLLFSNETLYKEIMRQNPIGSKGGLKIGVAEGDGDDLEGGDLNGEEGGDKHQAQPKIKVPESKKEEKEWIAKFAAYYSRILFFAFLTKSEVSSLANVIEAIDADDMNIRIAKNIELRRDILEILLSMNPFNLSDLDYKIQNINKLANDDGVEPIERCTTAMRKFGRMSESEVVTPIKIADEMVAALPIEDFNKESRILDISSKQGEFAIALYKRFGDMIKDNIYSIPSSKIAYEFTRKIYEALGMPLENIYTDFISYDIIKEENTQIIEELKGMNFDAVIGNPPYQLSDGGAKASAKPIYNNFVDLAKAISKTYVSIIMPTRWYAGGKGLDEFRDEMLNDNHIQELHDFLNPADLFPDTNIRGGVCVFTRNTNYDNSQMQVKVVTHQTNKAPITVMRPLRSGDSDIFIRHGIAISIIDKVNRFAGFSSFSKIVSSRKPFGLDGNFTKDEKFRSASGGLKRSVICYGKSKQIGYVELDEITKKKDWINKYKVYTPRANNIGTELNDDNLNTFIGEPNTICTESYIVLGADLNLNLYSAQNLSTYCKTKFVRFMHSLSKASQDATAKTYKFVPIQNFSESSDIVWSKSVAEIDYQLYTKYRLGKDEVDFIESSIKTM